jgi:peroxiredoxin
MRVVAPVLLLVASFVPLRAMPPLPRKSPEFTIIEPSGKRTLLSSYRGKVVVLGWIHTTCIYCQAFSATLGRIQKDLGPKGFQPLAVAWNEDAREKIPAFVKRFDIKFPIGYSDWTPIMNYMGFSVMERPVTPLVVVIDKKGMIRAQTPAEGDGNLQNEKKLRVLIEDLLKESTGARRSTPTKREAATQ